MATFHPGSILVRTMCLAEAAINTISGLFLIVQPAKAANFIVASSVYQNTLSEHLLQIFGACTIVLAVPLALGYPNTSSGVATRKLAYIMNIVGEGILVPLVLIQIDQGALNKGVGYAFASSLFGLLAFRIYTMIVKPELTGYIIEERKAQ